MLLTHAGKQGHTLGLGLEARNMAQSIYFLMASM